MPLVAYLLMCTIFGTTYLAIKVGLDAGLPPLLFAALRFFLAAPITLGIVALRRLPLPRRPDIYVKMAVVGLYNTTLLYATLFWAEQHISSGLAAILGATSPMLVIIVQRKLSQTALWVQVAGLVTGLLGVVLVVLPHLQPGLGAYTLIASALVLVSALALALGSVKARAAMDSGVDPLVLNGFQMLFGGLGLFLCSLLFEFPVGFTMDATAWTALGYLSVAGSVVAFGIFYWLVARTGPLFPATWTYVSPVIATVAGALALNEPIGWQTLGGLFLVLTGAGLTDPGGIRRLLHGEGGLRGAILTRPPFR